MALARPSFETDFIREFSKTYIDEISYVDRAETDMSNHGVGIPDILHVFQKGHVVVANKEDLDGAQWTVEGETTEGQIVRIGIQVWASTYRIRVLCVELKV